MNWTIVDGVRVRANYAESFTAPALTSRGDINGVTAESSFGGLLGATASGVNANFAIPNTYPGAIGLPGCTAATPTCLINTASVPGVFLAGGNDELIAQEGETYSVGIDIEPAALAGLRFSVDVVEHEIHRRDHGATGRVRDRLARSQQPAATLPGRRAAARRLAAATAGLPQTSPLAATSYFIYSFQQRNAFNLDATASTRDISYRFDTDFGNFNFGLAVPTS